MKVRDTKILKQWDEPRDRCITYLIQGMVSIGYNDTGYDRETLVTQMTETLMHDPRRATAFPIFGGHS